MKKKMVAPIVVTVLLIVYYGLYFGLLMWLMEFMWLRVLFGIIPVALGAVMIYVCIQRIQEIRSGEEDDLSKY